MNYINKLKDYYLDNKFLLVLVLTLVIWNVYITNVLESHEHYYDYAEYGHDHDSSYAGNRHDHDYDYSAEGHSHDYADSYHSHF